MTQRREGRIRRCQVDAERSRRLLKFLVADCCEGLPDLAELLRERNRDRGRGVPSGRKLRANAEPLAIRGRIDDEFVVGPLRRGEGVLGEADETVVRMVEQPEPAFADLNGLLVPRFCEERALAAERFDEYLDLCVAKRAGEVRAKFREQSPRPIPPCRNQRASGKAPETRTATGCVRNPRPASREKAAPLLRSSSTRSRGGPVRRLGA